MDIKRELADTVSIPDRCKGCNHLERVGEVYDFYSSEYEGALDAGLTGEASQRFIEGLVMSGVPREDAEREITGNPDKVRDVLLSAADSMDDAREQCTRFAERLVGECSDGLLKMRATRNGKQIIVSVCMSEAIRGAGQAMGNVEPVRVERKY